MSSSTVINIVIIAAAAFFFYLRFAPIKGLTNLSAKEFEQEIRQPDALLIDVREPQEFKGGFIPKAKNIPLSQLKGRLNEIPSGKRVYLYCRSGMRSKQAARILKGDGFASLAHLKGGIQSWSGKLSK